MSKYQDLDLKFETVSNNVNNFDIDPIVIGEYLGTKELGKGAEAFKVHQVADISNGEIILVSSYVSIDKAIESRGLDKDKNPIAVGQIVKIELKEKAIYKNKPFFVFNVGFAIK
jgi:hypothetical protein